MIASPFRLLALLPILIPAMALGQSLVASSKPISAETRDPWLWPFASTSPWNIPIGSGAQYSTSDQDITKDLISLRPVINCGRWSLPLYLARSTDPVRKVIGDGSGIPGDGKGNQLGIYDRNIYDINFPANAQPDPGSGPAQKDGHLFIVTPNHQTVTEMYFYNRAVLPKGDVNPLGAIQNDLYGDGWGHPGERAMSSSAFGGIIREDEVRSFSIPHAITFSVPPEYAKSGPVWPSTTEDSFGLKGQPWAHPYTGRIPMGTLIAIPPSLDVTVLGLTPSGLMLAHCLQDYGAYMADTGGKKQINLYVEDAVKDMPQIKDMRTDFVKLGKYLAVVVNNTPTSVGGGDIPRRPAAPDLMPADTFATSTH